MPTRPLVSVITPTYNRARFLPETIESVLSQEYSNLEYIVADDGSTDETPTLQAKYASRILWTSHDNMGEAHTVNRGLGMAQGDIVGVVNSDDPVLPGLVEAVVAAFAHDPSLLVVYPDWVMIDQDSKPLRRMRAPAYDYLTMVRWQWCLIGPGAFLRRSALALEGGRNPAYRYIGDLDFWLRLGRHGPFAGIPRALATHRVHPSSGSAEGGEAKASEHMRLVEEFFGRADLPPAVRQVRQEAYSSAAYLAGRSVMAISPASARRYFVQSLRASALSYVRWRPERIAMLLVAFLPTAPSRMLARLFERVAGSPARYYAAK
jgi:glycosyltransferase involved in cell wall biosynthesis